MYQGQQGGQQRQHQGNQKPASPNGGLSRAGEAQEASDKHRLQGNALFEQYLGTKYARDIQEMQMRFGPMHQTSHSLKDGDFMLGHLVTAGINNLATLVMQAKQARSQPTMSLQPVPISDGGGMVIPPQAEAYSKNQQATADNYNQYRYYGQQR
jgi:hypothetical protein